MAEKKMNFESRKMPKWIRLSKSGGNDSMKFLTALSSLQQREFNQ